MNLFEKVITAIELKTEDRFSEENSWIVENIVPVGQAGLVVAPSK